MRALPVALSLLLAPVGCAGTRASRPAGTAAPATSAAWQIPADTAQLVVVTTSDFDAPHATLRRYERDASGWRAVGEADPVMVGRTGLGWGRGLYPQLAATAGAPPLDGPRKHEGDGKAPAGVFRLVEATGYAAAPPDGTTLRYRQATDRLRCVDDTDAPEYNRLAEAPPVDAGAPAWKSDEHMRRADALYEWTVVVEHNRDPVERGAGSCIFLHVWRGPDAPTVGCTAMPPEHMRALLAWLDASKHPLLVQMPIAPYRALQKTAGLPAADANN